MTLDIKANGTDLIDTSFSSDSAAQSYFTDHPLDLGSIASISGGEAFQLQISLSETINAAASGFYAGFIVGDPPPSASTSDPQAPLAQALYDASFGSTAGVEITSLHQSAGSSGSMVLTVHPDIKSISAEQKASIYMST